MLMGVADTVMIGSVGVVALGANVACMALLAKQLLPGQMKEVVFWRRSFALFRGMDGALRCIDSD